jgi:hypothetical protein
MECGNHVGFNLHPKLGFINPHQKRQKAIIKASSKGRKKE